MSEFDRAQLRQWAVRGAEQRLLEIANEAAAIHRAFPELRRRTPGAGESVSRKSETGKTARKRGKMSAANRRAVSERMKKYWAARRGGASPASPVAGAAKTAKGTGRRPRKMSAAGRKRISDAQKKRWAAKRKEA